jgi:hypothetical protein
MVAFISVIGLTGLMIWFVVGLGFWLLVTIANLIYRTSKGRWFPWWTRSTIVPFLGLGVLSFVVAYNIWSHYPGPH